MIRIACTAIVIGVLAILGAGLGMAAYIGVLVFMGDQP